MSPKYKRLLVKLSGEQLAGEGKTGIDAKTVAWIAGEVKAATELGTEVVIVVGAGNLVRGARMAGGGISRVNADYMGILSTVINGLAVTDIFNANGVESRLLSSLKADQVADHFTPRRAVSHLQKGRVVVIGGGTSVPFMTTDTASVTLALQLNCEVVCKLTKVDGVYSKDPVKFTEATRFERLSFREAVENPHIQVMDKSAMGMAMEENMPIAVFALHEAGNLRRFAAGEAVGTVIS